MNPVILTPAERVVLDSAPLWAQLPEDDLALGLADPGCVRREYAPGAVIYTLQSFQRSLGVVLEGTVEVTRGDYLVSLLGPSELFGAAALFNDAPDYVTTLTARTPCVILLFSQELMARLMGESPVLAGRYVAYLSGRIRFLSEKMVSLLSDGAKERLEHYLVTRAEGGGVVPDCSLQELARRLGMSRATLYRAMEALEAAGTITRSGRRFTLNTTVWKGSEIV